MTGQRQDSETPNTKWGSGTPREVLKCQEGQQRCTEMCSRTDFERSTKKMGKYQEDDAPSGADTPSGADMLPSARGVMK